MASFLPGFSEKAAKEHARGFENAASTLSRAAENVAGLTFVPKAVLAICGISLLTFVSVWAIVAIHRGAPRG